MTGIWPDISSSLHLTHALISKQLHTGPEVLFGNVETGKTVRYSDKVVNLYIHAVCVHPQV